LDWGFRSFLAQSCGASWGSEAFGRSMTQPAAFRVSGNQVDPCAHWFGFTILFTASAQRQKCLDNKTSACLHCHHSAASDRTQDNCRVGVLHSPVSAMIKWTSHIGCASARTPILGGRRHENKRLRDSTSSRERCTTGDCSSVRICWSLYALGTQPCANVLELICIMYIRVVSGCRKSYVHKGLATWPVSSCVFKFHAILSHLRATSCVFGVTPVKDVFCRTWGPIPQQFSAQHHRCCS
jgi:hypothetical protein